MTDLASKMKEFEVRPEIEVFDLSHLHGAKRLVDAGLMSDRPFEEVEAGLRALRACARELGCALPEPFLQLAFLPLPVIPHLKLTDKGLVDVDRFELIAA